MKFLSFFPSLPSQERLRITSPSQEFETVIVLLM